MSIVYMLACNLMLQMCHWHRSPRMDVGRTKEWKVVSLSLASRNCRYISDLLPLLRSLCAANHSAFCNI